MNCEFNDDFIIELFNDVVRKKISFIRLLDILNESFVLETNYIPLLKYMYVNYSKLISLFDEHLLLTNKIYQETFGFVDMSILSPYSFAFKSFMAELAIIINNNDYILFQEHIYTIDNIFKNTIDVDEFNNLVEE